MIPPRQPAPDTVGGILRRYGSDWISGRTFTLRQASAIGALQGCRTAANGTRRDECSDCRTVRFFHLSCGDRHCPQCQFTTRQAWLDARRAELLPVPYFHGVFTLPHEYNALVPYNEELIYALVFRTAADVLLAAARRQLRGTAGLIALLHTWTQRLERHVHVHFIVPGGALTARGRWRPAPSDRWLFDVRELMRAYRRSLSRRLKAARTRGRLTLPPHLSHLDSKRAFGQFVDGIASKNWEVYLKPPFAGPEKVLEYVANYTHRVAIGNGRIVDTNNGCVSFTWHDRRNSGRQKTERIPAAEFLDRFALHLLPRRFTKIRYFGFYAGRDRNAHLAAVRKALQVDEPPETGRPDPAALWRAATGEDLKRCPVCGGRMHTASLTGRWHRAKAPPEIVYAPAA